MSKKPFFKPSLADEKNVNGILYILYIDLEDKQLQKIGVTRRLRIEERVSEILCSIFTPYRVFPRCYPKRFSRTTDIFEKESMLHRYFSSCRYVPASSFSGSTEVFTGIDEDHLLEMYERVLLGEDIDKLDRYKIKEDISTPNV